MKDVLQKLHEISLFVIFCLCKCILLTATTPYKKTGPAEAKPASRKLLLLYSIICSALTLSPAQTQAAQEQVTLESLHTQLITAVENEIATNKELSASYVAQLKHTIPLWKEKPSHSTIEARVEFARLVVNQQMVTQKTKLTVNQCIKEIYGQLDQLTREWINDNRKTIGALLRSLIKSSNPDEISKCISECKDYKAKIANADYRNGAALYSEIGVVLQFMEHWLNVRNDLNTPNARSAAYQFAALERTAIKITSFLSAEEIARALQGLREDIGVLTPEEMETLWRKSIDDLLHDANQNRLDEIMLALKNAYELSEAINPKGIEPSRFEQVERFVTELKASIQNVKEGNVPEFRAVNFTRRNGYEVPPFMNPEQWWERLQKYQIRSKDKDGNEVSTRLCYSVAELQAVPDQMLAQVLDDDNQNRLADLQKEIKTWRAYAMTNGGSSATNIIMRLDQLKPIADMIAENIDVLHRGGQNRPNMEPLFANEMESVTLIRKQELLQKLKQYQVLMKSHDGAEVLRPLYADIKELLQKVKSFREMPALLSEFGRATAHASVETGTNAHPWLMNSLTRCAEVASLMHSGESFVLPYPPHIAPSNNQESSTATATSEPAVKKLQQLEAEAEWAVIQRFFPKEEYHPTPDHEAALKSLMKRFQDQKNYEAMSQLHLVSHYFKPTRQLLSLGQAQAIRDYLRGVSQQDELDQPRLAVFYLQKTATSSTTVIDRQLLKSRLQSLRKNYPADYEKGIDDALRSPSTETPPREIEVPSATK